MALLTGGAIAWMTLRGLLRLLDYLGIPSEIRYATPQTRWTTIGDWPALIKVTSDALPAGLASGWIGMTLGWYAGRAVLRRAADRPSSRRTRWMLAGNVLYATSMGAFLQCEMLLLERLPLPDWLAGAALFMTFSWGTAGFMQGWRRLMRWRRIPGALD
ncbi:MAG: hypothetical protein QM581_00330 [Pseudomonas sp.]